MSEAVAIAAIAEVAKLLIMAKMQADRSNMTPEQFEAVYQAVKNGFAARDPKNIPDV